MVYVNFVPGCNFVSVSRYWGKVFEARNISYEPFGREAFWLRYKDYHGLRCVITGARFRFGRIRSTGARCLKLGSRHRIREGPPRLGGAAGPNASPLRGGADRGGLARLPARPAFVLRGSSGEERSGGAGVGGQPVEVFVGKRFCGVAGCVDDADGMGVVEDRDG